MKKINTRKALNPAYRKHKPYRAEVKQFVEQLKECLVSIKWVDDNNESEEHLKEPLKKFLQKTFYSENYINTKDKIDLAIYLGKNAKSDIGVIIEAKKPSNKAQFLTPDNLNKKALQELLLYYLRERLDNKNNNIKHLIATNGYEWYLFKAEDFYNIFFKNKALIKEYEAFRDGLKDTTKNELFYDEIAKKYINQLQDQLPFVHLDFNKTNFDSINDAALNTLYKVFSNVNLLGHSFGNDSNQLNKVFYNELLHIIGLEEVKDKGKKIIYRKSEKTKDYGSLLENTIFSLEDKDYLRNAKGFDADNDKAFNVGLDLCLTWINRILFLKLLESQLLTYHKGAKEYKFLQSDFISGFDDLNNLFFSALAKKPKERHLKYKDKFQYIPYLNSSLFERSEIETDTFEISALNDDKMEVLSTTILKDAKGKRFKGKLNTLDYLFKFLDAYDFATDGTEGIADEHENKTLINASVLGLIFEKINGYKEGSFYTPAYITMYMCKETLRRAVVQKFKERENDQIETFEDLQVYCQRFFKVEDSTRFNNIVNSLRVCDPAVGSGHFLVSALNELIAIKNELGILVDAKGVPIRCDLQIENDELYITDDRGFLFEYNPNDKESARIQHTLFHEKQIIIENCLFGVDINPNSVKICRLRLWIELLKNAYYTNKNELQTLPNIDINIKCGNSLISRFDLKDDLKDAFNGNKVNYSFKDYKNAVSNYKETNDKNRKLEITNIIDEVKGAFKQTFYLSSKENKKLSELKGDLVILTTQNIGLFGRKLSNQDLKIEKRRLEIAIQEAQKEVDDFKNNMIFEKSFEWRFEFPEVLDDEGNYIGFDVIVGNPPYIYNRDLEKNQRDFLKGKYNTADDLYVYFTYESLRILKPFGYLSLITPDTYFTLSSRQKFRAELLKLSFLKFTYSGFCFEDAYVETMIFITKKELKDNGEVNFVTEPKDYNNYEVYSAESSIFQDNLYTRFFIPSELNIKLNHNINFRLKNVANIFDSKLNGRAYDEVKLSNYEKKLNQNDFTLLGLLCSGEQGLVTGNNSKYVGNIVVNLDEKNKIDKKFISELNKYLDEDILLKDLQNDYEKYYDIAENLKIKNKKPDLFGKFFIYKTQYKSDVKEFSTLGIEISKNGGNENLWVNYYKGNSDGFKWFVPYNQAINWSIKMVKELKEGLKTNSRWQGEKFFSTTGFGWVDYFTKGIKAFFVDKGIYSKNIVKLHSDSNLISDKYIVGLLNSKFISYYIKNFITTTHTLQINDGRLIPIIIPSASTKLKIEELVTAILHKKEESTESITKNIENEIDLLVFQLYGLTKEEITIVENS